MIRYYKENNKEEENKRIRIRKKSKGVQATWSFEVRYENKILTQTNLHYSNSIYRLLVIETT